MPYLNFFILIFCLAITSGCTPKDPYEIRSPCVSNHDQTNALLIPCIRRPVGRAIV